MDPRVVLYLKANNLLPVWTYHGPFSRILPHIWKYAWSSLYIFIDHFAPQKHRLFYMVFILEYYIFLLLTLFYIRNVICLERM